MTLHAQMSDPPNFTGYNAANCPKCNSQQPAAAQQYSDKYAFNVDREIVSSNPGAEDENTFGDFILRTCSQCQFPIGIERPLDNPRTP